MRDVPRHGLAVGRECVVTLDEFESWLEEYEAGLWENVKRTGATIRERGMWHGANDILLMWEKVKRDGSES